MLNDAVLQGQGRAAPEREVRVEIPVSAYIPGDYVALEAAKIDLHRRIGLAEDLERVAALRAEVEDRFGPVPPPVDALLAVQRLRIKLREAGASQLAVRSGRVTIAPGEPHQPGPAGAARGHAGGDLRGARAHRVAAGRARRRRSGWRRPRRPSTRSPAPRRSPPDAAASALRRP